MSDIVLPAPVMALKADLGPNGLMIYACLAETCNEVGQTSVDYDTLQDMSGLSRTVVSRAIALLASHHLISKQRRFSQSTIYTLVHYVDYRSLQSGLMTPISTTPVLLTTPPVNQEPKNIQPEVAEGKSTQNGLMDSNTSSHNGLVKSFQIADANVLLCTLTGWGAVPGSNDDRLHYLGVVMDLHDKHNAGTLEYLRPFWDEFRRRYPRSTKMFWLTEWAVQGIVPDDPKKPKPAKPLPNYAAYANGEVSDDEPDDAPADPTWDAVLSQLHMSPAQRERYLDPCRVVTAGPEYVIAAPDAAARDWLAGRLTSTLARILTGIRGEDTTVKFITED